VDFEVAKSPKEKSETVFHFEPEGVHAYIQVTNYLVLVRKILNITKLLCTELALAQ